MKKIPTLFKREFINHRVVKVYPEITEGLENVLSDGIATIKWDGACVAIINGVLHKRYDAKHGKPIPENAIKCQEVADPITGHLPCWLPCDRNNPADKWFWVAYDRANNLTDGTYEAVGYHFNGNPYGYNNDIFIPHGKDVITVERTFEGIESYLQYHKLEGLVFWLNNEPRAKIKRSDFGFSWK